MTLSLEDRWIWDFWLVAAGGLAHVFYLQAPRSLGDPQARHWHVSIGHAVSADLVRWEVLPDALAPGPPGAWDDCTTWTGSVVRHGGCWKLLYTGTRRAESGLVQRVGLATSDDLLTWQRHAGGPVLEADPRWYRPLDRDDWHDHAWRDPWVLPDPGGDGFHAYVTARSTAPGERLGRGVIGHARSADLVDWQVGAPVTVPMGFGQMEVPQVLQLGGRWYLLFSSDTGTQHPARAAGLPGTGTYYLVGDSPEGPFEASTLGVLAADEAGSSYAGRVFELDGEPLFLAWNGPIEGGAFRGGIGDPRTVEIRRDGRLQLAAAPTRQTGSAA
jgi:beta-fructofuranosidase